MGKSEKEQVKPLGGEGDREADRRYREKTREFVEEKGERASRGPNPDKKETEEIERAEEQAGSHAREKDPSVTRDYDKPAR